MEQLRARLRPVAEQLGTNAVAQHDRALAQSQQRISERVEYLRKELLVPPRSPRIE